MVSRIRACASSGAGTAFWRGSILAAALFVPAVAFAAGGGGSAAGADAQRGILKQHEEPTGKTTDRAASKPKETQPSAAPSSGAR